MTSDRNLERLGEHIIANLSPEDALERKKLIGAIEVGQRVAEFLQSELADEDSYVDTGSDGTGYDCEVMVNGREYSVSISPGSTDAEMEEWEAERQVEASKWDLLCPRVIEALKAGPDKELAAEFEAYVTPPPDAP